MPTGRPIRLPVDPWPRASLGERAAVGSVLMLLLAVPCAAAAFTAMLGLLLVHHACRSYDVGAAIRAMIDRR